MHFQYHLTTVLGKKAESELRLLIADHVQGISHISPCQFSQQPLGRCCSHLVCIPSEVIPPNRKLYSKLTLERKLWFSELLSLWFQLIHRESGIRQNTLLFKLFELLIYIVISQYARQHICHFFCPFPTVLTHSTSVFLI